MTALTRHVRMAYLLALFQVLGGPALVCGVIAWTRFAGERQPSLAQNAERAVHRLQQHRESAPRESAVTKSVENAAPHDQPWLPAPKSPENGKVKFVGVIHCMSPPEIGVGFVRGHLCVDAPLERGKRESFTPWQPPRAA